MDRLCAPEGKGTPGGAGNAAGFKERRASIGPVLAVVAAVLALAAAAPAGAQSTLVSNTGQSNDYSISVGGPSDWIVAQRFTTGDNTAGYTLSEVDMHIGSFASADGARVSIYSKDASGNPGSSLHVLTNTSITSGDFNTFTAPTNTTLSADTDYFVVMEATSGSFNGSGTDSAAEDSGAASGWSINDEVHSKGTGDWTADAGSLLIAVKGTAVTVTASDVDTLGALSLADEFGAEVDLDPAFATGTTAYGAEVANAVARITVAAEPTDSDASVAYEDGDGNALTDLDGDAEHFQADIAPGENVVKVVVTAENDTDTETYTVTVTRGTAVDADAVPGDWSLKPDAVGPGERFRLLFLSSTKRDASSTDIAVYNTHVQEAAAAGHADIQPFADGFTVVGSTDEVNVRTNTLTRADDVDAAIYWVRESASRSAVADDYADFYDGTWGDTSPRTETGGAATMDQADPPVTGSNAGGTTPSGVLGGDRFFDLVVTWHLVGSSVLASGTNPATDQSRLLGLSPIFRAAGGPSASLAALSVADGGGEAVALVPEFTPATTTYAATVESRRATVLAEPADALATVAYFDGEGAAIVDRDGNAEGLQVDLETGANVVRVTVTATDGIATRTYEVTLTSAYATLVHNTGQTVLSSNSGNVQAQGFTTGSDPGGYRVGSVAVRLDSLGADAAATDTHVRIFSDNSGPDASIAALTSPSLEANAFNVFTAGERVFLDPDTTYHVMVNRGLDTTSRVSTSLTDGNGQSSDHGWTIADDRRSNAANTPTTWTTFTSVLLMDVRGEVLPECTVDLGGRTEIWTGVVTVEGGSHIPLGDPLYYGFRGSAGALSDTDFDFGSTTGHQISAVSVSTSEFLLMELPSDFPATDRPALRLHACGDTFDLADASGNGWANSGLDWSDAYKVTLALSASPDATLSDLATNGTSLPGFASNDYDYAITVLNATTRITVEPTVAERGALVTFLDGDDAALADADTATDVFDMDLAVGANTVKVQVVSGDRANTLTYVVTVTRNTTTVTNNDPTFDDGTSTTRDVDENSPSGTAIGAAVAASDIDVGDNLTYSLGGTDGASFAIDTASGQLRTSAALDFEADDSYSVTVEVDDGSGGTASIDVTITVNDRNEKPDTPGAPTVTTTADTTDSLTVTWTKPGLNGGPDIVGYKLQYRSDDAWTEVPSTITATTHTIPNLAEGTTYQVQVRALNDGETDSDWSPSGSGTTGSSSNNPPEFNEGATATRSVNENTGSGIFIGNAVEATDDDTGDTLTYTLEGTDRTSFRIVPGTGQLLTSAALDFESDSSYSVRVKVEDTSDASDTIDVTIDVVDQDEQSDTPGAPTVRAAVDKSDSLTVTWTRPGRNGGPRIDGYRLRYRVAGTAEWTETTPAGTATATVIGALSEKTTYEVQVRALNGEIDSDWSRSGRGATEEVELSCNMFMDDVTVHEGETARFTIEISPPLPRDDVLLWGVHTFGEAGYPSDLPYTGASVELQAGATEVEGAVETYTDDIEEPTERFSIILDWDSWRQRPDWGSTPSCGGMVHIRDGESNAGPTFDDGERTTRSVDENTAPGKPVGRPVTATDHNDDPVTYALEGPDAASFRIDAGTGQLRTHAALDYEAKASYAVTVKAEDDRGDAATIAVTVKVDDDIYEQPATPAAPTVTAVPGTSDSLEVTWTEPARAGGPEIAYYRLCYGTGTSGCSTTGTYRGTRGVLDGLAADEEYRVHVRSYDENQRKSDWSAAGLGRTNASGRPVFDDGEHATRTVAENTERREKVGAPVSATDPDGRELHYTLGGPDAGSFRIDWYNGQLRTFGALDHETKASYAVTVTADDKRDGPTTIDVTVEVGDVDEPPGTPSRPKVEGGETHLSVRWNPPNSEDRPPASGYDLRYRVDGSGTWTDGPRDVAEAAATIDGVAEETEYEVQVLARSDEGESGWSKSGRGSTAAGGRTVHMGDVTVYEGETAEFTMEIRPAPREGEEVRFSWHTSGVSARAGLDFRAADHDYDLEVGQGEVAGEVETFTDDEVHERTETVSIYMWLRGTDANDVDFSVRAYGRIEIRNGPRPAAAAAVVDGAC